jgi:hypothetical protein
MLKSRYTFAILCGSFMLTFASASLVHADGLYGTPYYSGQPVINVSRTTSAYVGAGPYSLQNSSYGMSTYGYAPASSYYNQAAAMPSQSYYYPPYQQSLYAPAPVLYRPPQLTPVCYDCVPNSAANVPPYYPGWDYPSPAPSYNPYSSGYGYGSSTPYQNFYDNAQKQALNQMSDYDLLSGRYKSILQQQGFWQGSQYNLIP